MTATAMPYPGLRPFEAEDQPVFFGREEQVSALLRRMEDSHFIAVVGSSGSGKSSLVRAGLLPALREGFLFGTADWLSATIRPGTQPYRQLARCLVRADDADPATQKVLSLLRRSDDGLLAALAELALPPGAHAIVVVDQFEELFAFRRATAGRDDSVSRDEAAAFVRLLLQSSRHAAGRLWVVLTMRSDFIGDCEAFLGLPEAVSDSQFLVPRLDRRQMEEAIVRPGELTGAAFRPFTCATGLVNRIVNDAGDRPDQLPLMQHALMRTWKHAVTRHDEATAALELTLDDYEVSGTIERALALDADAAWKDLGGDAQRMALARRMFLLLCDVSPDGQITRRRPRIADVLAGTGAGVGDVEHVARVFQSDDRNFLLPAVGEPPHGQRFEPGTHLDVSHEALLRRWPRFAEWLEQEREHTAELRRLVDLARLQARGEGGWLGKQDLERVSRWRAHVTPEWASRYVTAEEWESALQFVAASEAEVKRADEAEAQRQLAARRLQRVLRLAVAGGLAVLVLAIVAGFWQRAREAELQFKTASELTFKYETLYQERSLQVASQLAAAAAMTQAELDPELALALAAEAVKIAPTAQAESALRRALFNDGTGAAANESEFASGKWFAGHKGDVVSVAFSPDGRTFMTTGCDHTARLWDAETGGSVRVLIGHRSPIMAGAFSPDGKQIVTAGGNYPCGSPGFDRSKSGDNSVRVWDAATGRLLQTLTGSTELLMGAAFSPDGRSVAAAGFDSAIHLWDLATQARSEVGRGPQGFQWLSFSPDGRQIATSGGKGVIVWGRSTGGEVKTLEHPDMTLAVTYNATGDLLASADISGVARIWRTTDWALQREVRAREVGGTREVRGNTGLINAAGFSGDGRFLLTAGGGAQIWEVATGARIRQLRFGGSLFGAAFSPDGRKVALGGANGRVVMFDCDACVPLETLKVLLSQRRVRPLTEQELDDFVRVRN